MNLQYKDQKLVLLYIKMISMFSVVCQLILAIMMAWSKNSILKKKYGNLLPIMASISLSPQVAQLPLLYRI